MLLVGWQEGHPACKKTEWWGAGMVICLERSADLHMAQLMPLPLTISCFSKIQIGFTFLVPAHPSSPGKRAVKQVCVHNLHSKLFRKLTQTSLHIWWSYHVCCLCTMSLLKKTSVSTAPTAACDTDIWKYTSLRSAYCIYADNVALPAFTRCMMLLLGAGHAATDSRICCPLGSQQQTCNSGFAAVGPAATDRQMDGRTRQKNTVQLHKLCILCGQWTFAT